MDRTSVARFNKLFLEQKAAFRRAIGEIIARHASDGNLKSGYTIKLSYQALEHHLTAGITDCLLLVSNKTDHHGSKRKALLADLQGVALHFANAMNDQLLSRLKIVLGESDSARAETKRIFDAVKEACIDQIGKFADGVTSPKDLTWVQRHPLINLGIGALIGSVVTAAIASFFKLL